MTLAQTLAEFVNAAVVPEAARQAAHIAIVDCVGCIVAGADTDTVRALTRTVGEQDGPATLLGLGRRTGLRDAALINGTAAHALDYDDICWTLYGHPSVAILPPLLALAEAENIDYADVLDAYAIGVEVAAKLGQWANPALYLRGWHATAALGVLGAAAAAARLMRQSSAQTTMTLAIAASHASGLRENFGTMVKPLHAGRAAEAALLSALLGRAGFTGSEKALDGRFGYFAVLHTNATPTPAEALKVLGQPWEVNEPGIVLKRYASCGATHCALDALLDIRNELGFSGSDVREIRCGAEPLALKVLQYSKPVTGLQGKFSMQFCLAVAAQDGQPLLGHFADAWATNPAIVDLMAKVVVKDRPDFDKGRNDAVPAEVEVVLKDGRSERRTVAFPSGDPRNPMSETERNAKFMDCVGGILPDGAAAWRGFQAIAEGGSLRPVLEALRGSRQQSVAA